MLMFDWSASSQFTFSGSDWMLLQANSLTIKGRFKLTVASIPTTVNMATPLISDLSDEQSEMEGVVKLKINEEELMSPQHYKMEEDTEEDPSDEDTVFDELPPHKQ